jgi:iron complex transport system substrate-binding protein
MRRAAALLVLAIFAAACGPVGTTDITRQITTTVASPTTTARALTTTIDDGFPVTVNDSNGPVDIPERPVAIVSLSATATEMLFAIGAGDQVVAVDEFSDYPAEAPTTSLSGFNPNLEAILTYGPDLVVASWDPGELVAGLTAFGVPVLLLPTAYSLDDSYTQTETLGVATGQEGEAAELVTEIQTDIALVVEGSPDLGGLTIYHEADPSLYAASSFSFIGQLYEMLGLINVADEADPDGWGFPQLSSEYLVAADPGFIFLADASLGVTPESLGERSGWEEMSAVANGAVEVLDEDIASRWGPRVVDLLRSISDAVSGYVLSS